MSIMDKGQASTEYLITFATIIAFTVALISLFSYYTENSREVQQMSSFNYWASLEPFAVKEWRQYPNGTFVVYLKNVGLRAVIFYNMSVDGVTIGKKKRVPINSVFEVKGTLNNCTEKELVMYENVTIYYTPVGNNSVLTRKGTVPIIILCQ